MEEVKEEVQAKPELKEEYILPLLETGVDVDSIISTIKREDEEFIEALVNVTKKEEKHPVKFDSETKPSILTSLVKVCSGRDVSNDHDDLGLKNNNGIKVKTEEEYYGEEFVSSVADTSHQADFEERVEVIFENNECNEVEGELEGDNMDDGKIDCIVNFESGESSLEHMEDFNLDHDDQCNDVEETFEFRDSLSEHTKNDQPKKIGQKVSCKICGMEFKYKANCRKHEKLHDDVFRFKCQYCNISFKQSLTLKNHYIYVHETEKPYKCEDCDSSFKSANNLKSHIEVHHNFTGETFSCDFCQMEFRRRCYLNRHVLTHTNPDKKFTCADCGLKCRSKTDIAKHVLTHIGVVEKRFFCEVCSVGFSKHAHLVRHRRTHSVEKSFPCELCDRAYKDQYSLKTHHETVHLGITFSCEICGFQSDRHSLKKHLKRCDGQKKYTCQVCHKEYYLKKCFEQHMSKCHSKS